MKCIVFSDSHGSLQFMKEALLRNRDAEVVFFLGDGIYEAEILARDDTRRTWIAVKGNGDFYSEFNSHTLKKTESINLCGLNIAITHGDLFGVKGGYDGLFRFSKERDADIVLFGHTHVPEYKYFSAGEITERELHLFNPGSISISQGSFGLLTIEKNVLFSHGNLLQNSEKYGKIFV